MVSGSGRGPAGQANAASTHLSGEDAGFRRSRYLALHQQRLDTQRDRLPRVDERRPVQRGVFRRIEDRESGINPHRPLHQHK